MIAISLYALLVSWTLFGTSSAFPLNTTTTLATPTVTGPINHVWIQATTASSLDIATATSTEKPISDWFETVTTEPPTTQTTPSPTVAPAKPIDWDAFFEKVKQEDAKLPSNEEMFRSIKATLEKINPDFIPYRALHQTSGLKGMSPEVYESDIFLPYFNTYNPGHYYTPENLPRGLKYRLLILKQHFSPDNIMLMSPRDYARLCDQPENHVWANCNYFTHICEKVCNYKIWYPDYQYQPEWLTKTIVFDEVRESLIHNYLRNKVPNKRPATWVDPAYDQHVDDGMNGEDVQILAR